jgi:2-keto-3-deoxy-L-rhamnonate aldolase RhmA
MPATVRNPAREKLEQGQLSLGVGIRMTRSVEIAKAMAVAGFDWLFLDMEHGVMSLEACAQISTAALDAGVADRARPKRRIRDRHPRARQRRARHRNPTCRYGR